MAKHLVWILLWTPLCWGISDPTAPPSNKVEALASQPAAKKAPSVPRLNAIFYKSSQPGAVINQRFVQVGGSINGYKLVSLKANSITLARAGKHYTLRMSTPAIIKVDP